MIRILARGGAEAATIDAPDALWIDLESPTAEEEALVESHFGVDVPTQAERAAFEESARFYQEGGALFLTVTLLSRRDDGLFLSGAVTFILIQGKLVTVRQIRPRAFDVGQGRASARIGSAQDGGDVAMALFESAIERLADLLSELTREANTLSIPLFSETGPPPDLRAALRALGRIGALCAIAHESLSSMQRLVAFVRDACERYGLDRARMDIFHRDALQVRISYLQDAALGLINAAQTDVLKALSVATIAFVPATLVASIFGMNFDAMTWFRTGWGPWVGFLLMALAPAALFWLAKWRKWF